jgi:hypothetical protein
MAERRERFPGYDVLSKRDGPSWNEQTRKVVDDRLAIEPAEHRFFTDDEFRTLQAVCDRIVPQPADRERPVPIAALVDRKMAANRTDGFRQAILPPMGEAWRRGLAALDAEARAQGAEDFAGLPIDGQITLLKRVQTGATTTDAWGDMPPKAFFTSRVLHDSVSAYYAHPTAWSEIGFGGPASPRGYVRMDSNRRDPWEAVEARPGQEDEARRENTRVR